MLSFEIWALSRLIVLETDKVGDTVLCLHSNATLRKFKLEIHILMQSIHQVLDYLSSVFNDV